MTWKYRMLEAIIHEVSHMMMKTSENEAKEMEACAKRNLMKEERILEDDRRTPKSFNTTFSTLRCRTNVQRTCATFIIHKPPNWFLSTGELVEDSEPEEPWCGAVTWDHGPGVTPLTIFMCTGESTRICYRVYKEVCSGVGAFAPGRTGGALAACRIDVAEIAEGAAGATDAEA